MNDIAKFQADGQREIADMARDKELRATAQKLMILANAKKYSYHFTWLGLPIIQYPQDVLAMQELIWRIKPEVIVETGVARGGSLIFYASILELLRNNGQVIGVDIDIRPHNREMIEAHPLSSRIQLIQGSSVDRRVVDAVSKMMNGRRALVVLDSNHTHDHVLAELRAYASLVSMDSYMVVMDTVIEDLPVDAFPERPWKVGDNPKTAVHAFLSETDCFEIDHSIEQKLLLTVAPSGYLRRTK